MQQVAMLRAGSVQGQDPLLARWASHDQYAAAALPTSLHRGHACGMPGTPYSVPWQGLPRFPGTDWLVPAAEARDRRPGV